MKRFLAVVGALAMIGLAVVVRDRFADEDEAGSSDGDEVENTVICAPDLAEACRALAGVTVVEEVPGVTADRLVAGEPLGAAAWLVPIAWVELVAAEQARVGTATGLDGGAPVVRTRVVRAVWADMVEPLAAEGCDVEWVCLADLTGQVLATGDLVATGMPEIDGTSGLVVAAAQARSLAGRDDFASNDFDGTFTARARALAEGQAPDPLATMRTQGPGRYTVVGTYGADATTVSSTFGTIELRTDPVTLDLVVAVPSGGSAPDGIDALTDTLVAAGWSRPDDPALPPTDGLPDGGVLAAIRTLWSG